MVAMPVLARRRDQLSEVVQEFQRRQVKLRLPVGAELGQLINQPLIRFHPVQPFASEDLSCRKAGRAQ